MRLFKLVSVLFVAIAVAVAVAVAAVAKVEASTQTFNGSAKNISFETDKIEQEDITSLKFKAAPPKIYSLLSSNKNASDRHLNSVLAALDIRNTNNAKGTLNSLCTEVANTLASVSIDDCLKLKLKPSNYFSHFNRVLAYKEYSTVANRMPLNKILVIGGMHGDEYSSISVMFKWMQILDKHHSGKFHWMFVPLANPDGLIANKGTRYNGKGIDINRNFPTFDWQDKAQHYWQKKMSASERFYPGEKPADANEIKWLVELIKKFDPFIIISLHAPYGIIDIDGNIEAPSRLGNLKLQELGIYPGSIGNYGSQTLKIPVLTIELASSDTMPSKREISKIWTDLVLWLIKISK